MSSLLSRWIILGAMGLSLCFAANAQATVYMADSFLTGSNPAAGEYALGILGGQGPTVSSFTGTWADGLATPWPNTFDVVGTGLTWPDLMNVGGGAVQFVNDGFYGDTQAAVRTFTNTGMVENGDYWMACMMSFDEYFRADTTSSAFTGILNAEEGDPSVNWAIGVQWGFRGNGTGGVDAVVRHRAKVGTTYEVVEYVVAADVQPGNHLFVTYIDGDYDHPNSGDLNTVWFDPPVNAGLFNAGSPALSVKGYNWLDPGADPNRVVDTVVLNATNIGFDSVVTYDEVRFGDTWEEVVNPNGNIHPDGAVLAANSIDGYDHQGTYVRQWQETVSFGDSEVIQVGSVLRDPQGPAAMRGILSFPLDDIPEGTTVTGASLKLYVSRVVEDGGDVDQIDLYLADLPDEFDEMTANWLRAAFVDEIYDIPWGPNGPGNPTATLLSSYLDPTPETTEMVFDSSAAFIAAVQAAIDGDTPLDLALLAPFEDSQVRQFVEFYSEDEDNMFLHPVLTLTFGEATDVPGDTDGDGFVGPTDAAELAQNWLKTVYNGADDGDFNGDNIVNDLDASILAANWNPPSAEGVGVPEPSTFVLALAGLVLLWLRRRIA
ncbi:MAG: DNRLRE domain-containing protein [Pirellulales bacterium]|nr:DNRLRE domain-containing protein [Pirellulales bacterium]